MHANKPMNEKLIFKKMKPISIKMKMKIFTQSVLFYCLHNTRTQVDYVYCKKTVNGPSIFAVGSLDGTLVFQLLFTRNKCFILIKKEKKS